MAYTHKRDYENAIRKVTIKFGTKLNCESDDDAVIVVREPKEMEVLEWSEAKKDGTKAHMEVFKGMLKDMIIKHNLMDDDVSPMSKEAVVELIFEKTGLCDFVISEWIKAVFPSPPNSKGGK